MICIASFWMLMNTLVTNKQSKKEMQQDVTIEMRINHSGSSGGWEERTKLREKVILKFMNITLPIVPTAATIKLIKLGSCSFMSR